MAHIQLLQCKNQQKTSSNRLNIVPHKAIGIRESNGDVRILTGSSWPFLRTRSEYVAKIALNAAKLPKFAALNRNSWSQRMMVVKDLRQRSRLT